MKMSSPSKATSADALVRGYEYLKDGYIVPDFPRDMSAVKYVFILESPHKDELKHGCPAAGYTGRNMSAKLFGPKLSPLGRMIRDNDPSCRLFGIMNVCPVPMQGSAYKTGDLPAEARFAISGLEVLRNAPGKGPLELYEAVLRDFSVRVKSLHEGTVLLACGNFAADACVRLGIEPAYRLYHPYCWNFGVARASLEACPLFFGSSRS